jgi:hypothetical protein
MPTRRGSENAASENGLASPLCSTLLDLGVSVMPFPIVCLPENTRIN